MQTDYTILVQRLEAAELRASKAQRRLQLLGTLAITVTVATICLSSLPRAHADSTSKNPIPDILARLAILENKTVHLSSTDRDVTISGANVHIVDGSGSTGSSSSLGNLIVGYNASRGFGNDLRTGTHNLILGDRQNYSGFGGIVAGYSNSIVKPYASVTGGYNNFASGISSSITGGSNNVTMGDASAVSGGVGSFATGTNSFLPFDALAATVVGHSGQIASLQSTAAAHSGMIAGLQTATAANSTAIAANSSAIAALQANGGNTASVAALTTALAQETAARQAADTGLQTQMTAFTAGLAQEVTDRTTAITTVQTQLTSMTNIVTDLQTRTQFITADSTSKSMFISGANLFIQSGAGATDDFGTLTGLGNLTIGYNEPGNVNGDVRSGSHNLVLGQGNSYSSYGGFVAGQGNTISGRFTVVSGGQKNIASGDRSSVSGGYNNRAAKDLASITGGINNIASGFYSSVVGGCANHSIGDFSTISGGINNTAGSTVGGLYSSVSGGNANTAAGESSSILGGDSIFINAKFGHFP